MTVLNYRNFPHIIDRVVQLSERAELLAFRITCSSLRAVADRVLVNHISIGRRGFVHLAFTDPTTGERIPGLPWTTYDDQISTWTPPPLLEHVRVVDLLAVPASGYMGPLSRALTRLDTLRLRFPDMFDGSMDGFPPIAPRRLVQAMRFSAFGHRPHEDAFIETKVPYGVKHLVFTKLHSLLTGVPKIVHENPARHTVKTVTIVFCPEVTHSMGSQETSSELCPALLALLRQAAAELGSVAYTFVDLAEYLQAMNYDPGPGAGTFADRMYRRLRDEIKTEAIRVGTYAGSLTGVEFLSREEYRAKVGDYRYELDVWDD